jgi:hypothetical protein
MRQRFPSQQYNSPLRPIGGRRNDCSKCCDDMAKTLKNINISTTKILNSLKAEHLLDKKNAEKLKKDKENKERKEKETLLESSSRKVSNSIKSVIAPLKNVMDSIFRFILFTLAGRVVGNILKWFADPANEKKVKSLTRFFKDWWPAILGGFVLFGTRFGAAIRATVRMAISTILHLKKVGIPGIIAGLKKLGLFGLALAGGGGLLYLAHKLLNPDQKKEEDSTTIQKKGSQPPLKMASGGMVPRLNIVLPEEKHVSEISYAEGGAIDTASGISITGAGPDTQLIAAQPGEIVISKAAVDKFGADTFLRMNLMAGSSNKPKFANNIQFARSGGMVGKNQKINPSINVSSPSVTLPSGNFSYHNSLDKGSNFNLNLTGGMGLFSRHTNTSQNHNKASLNMLQRINNSQSYDSEQSSLVNRDYTTRSGYKMPTTQTAYPRLSATKYNVVPQIPAQERRIRYTAPRFQNEASPKLTEDSKPKETGAKLLQPQSKPLSVKQEFKVYISQNQNVPKAPRFKKSNSPTVMELPAIDLRATKNIKNSLSYSDVPDFSAIPRLSDRYGDSGILAIYGIEV